LYLICKQYQPICAFLPHSATEGWGGTNYWASTMLHMFLSFPVVPLCVDFRD